METIMRLHFIIGTISFFLCTAGTQDANVVKVSVFYEPICGGCRRFLSEDMKPTYDKIGKFMELDLVPYGFSSHEVSNGTYKFKCHGGPDQCRYLKIQSCALKYSNTSEVVDFISCLMAVINEDDVLEQCAKKSHVDLKKIVDCSNSIEGSILLAAYGDRTHSFKPKIPHVPTIVLNDKYNPDEEEVAIFHLLEAICKKLDPKPEECDLKIPVIQVL